MAVDQICGIFDTVSIMTMTSSALIQIIKGKHDRDDEDSNGHSSGNDAEEPSHHMPTRRGAAPKKSPPSPGKTSKGKQYSPVHLAEESIEYIYGLQQKEHDVVH